MTNSSVCAGQGRSLIDLTNVGERHHGRAECLKSKNSCIASESK